MIGIILKLLNMSSADRKKPYMNKFRYGGHKSFDIKRSNNNVWNKILNIFKAINYPIKYVIPYIDKRLFKNKKNES